MTYENTRFNLLLKVKKICYSIDSDFMKRKVWILVVVILILVGGLAIYKGYFQNNSNFNDNTLDTDETIKDNILDDDNSKSSDVEEGKQNEVGNEEAAKNNSDTKTNSSQNNSNHGNTTSSSNMNNGGLENLSKTYPKLEVISGAKISVGTTSKGYKIYTVNDVYYIDDIMMVNKTYGLPASYIPVNTKESCVGKTSTCNKCINITAYEAFNKMKADATAIGLNIYIASGYRPYVGQESIYNRYIKRDGKEAADTYSARPGYSEHQTSYSFDLNSITDSFINTKEGKWVNENAYLYGFIIRFPKGKDSITGYKYEPWHLRYVGYDLAKKLYNSGDWLSLEEYFGVDSKYQD